MLPSQRKPLQNINEVCNHWKSGFHSESDPRYHLPSCTNKTLSPKLRISINNPDNTAETYHYHSITIAEKYVPTNSLQLICLRVHRILRYKESDCNDFLQFSSGIGQVGLHEKHAQKPSLSQISKWSFETAFDVYPVPYQTKVITDLISRTYKCGKWKQINDTNLWQLPFFQKGFSTRSCVKGK